MTIGPKPEPRPLILHVDTDGNPRRLAEADTLYVTTINATNYENLPVTFTGTVNVTGLEVTSLQGTGVFLTTSVAQTTYLTQAAAEAGYTTNAGLTTTLANYTTNAALTTTLGSYATNASLSNYLTTANAATTYATNASLGEYAGPFESTPGNGGIPYYNDAWVSLPAGADGQVLTFNGGVPTWDDPCGTVTLPIAIINGGTGATTVEDARDELGLGNLALENSPLSISKGGTNWTGPYETNGLLYYNNTAGRLTSNVGLTFNGVNLQAPGLNLTNALTIANGGTNATTADGALQSLGGTTVGRNLIKLTNPGAETYLRINSNNTVCAVDAATYRSNLGLGTLATASVPVSIANGGTGSTSFPATNGVVTLVGGVLSNNTDLTFTPGTKTLNTATLTLDNPLGTAYGGTGQTSLASVNVNSFAGTGVFDTTANTTSKYFNKNTDTLPITRGGTNFTGPYENDGILYYNNTTGKLTSNSALKFQTSPGNLLIAPEIQLSQPLTVANGGTGQTSLASVNVNSLGGTGVFDTTANTTTKYFNKNTDTLSIARGGTNFTGPYTSNGLIYFDSATTAVKTNANFTFNGTTLAVPQIDLTTALSVADGGTGQTSLANVNITSFAGTGVFDTTANVNANYIAKPASPANEDLLKYSSGSWGRLTRGTTGQYLGVNESNQLAWSTPGTSTFDSSRVSIKVSTEAPLTATKVGGP